MADEKIAGAEVAETPAAAPADGATADQSPEHEQPTAEPQAPVAETEQPQPPDWRKTYEADETLRRYVDERAKVLADKRFQKEQRRQRLAEARSDPEKAQQFVAAEHDQLEADEPSPATKAEKTRQAQQTAQPALDALAKTEDGSWDQGYIALLQRDMAEATRRWNDDPGAYVRWVARELRTAEIDAAVKKAAPVLAEALATERTAQAMRNIPQPLLGAGMASSATDYQQLTPEARRELKKTPEGRRKLDELTARLA